MLKTVQSQTQSPVETADRTAGEQFRDAGSAAILAQTVPGSSLYTSIVSESLKSLGLPASALRQLPPIPADQLSAMLRPLFDQMFRTSDQIPAAATLTAKQYAAILAPLGVDTLNAAFVARIEKLSGEQIRTGNTEAIALNDSILKGLAGKEITWSSIAEAYRIKLQDPHAAVKHFASIYRTKPGYNLEAPVEECIQILKETNTLGAARPEAVRELLLKHARMGVTLGTAISEAVGESMSHLIFPRAAASATLPSRPSGKIDGAEAHIGDLIGFHFNNTVMPALLEPRAKLTASEITELGQVSQRLSASLSEVVTGKKRGEELREDMKLIVKAAGFDKRWREGLESGQSEAHTLQASGLLQEMGEKFGGLLTQPAAPARLRVVQPGFFAKLFGAQPRIEPY